MSARPIGFNRGDEAPDQPAPLATQTEPLISLPEVREDCLVVLGKVISLLAVALERSQGAEADWTEVRLHLARVTGYLGQALDALEYAVREES
jgi:hypothetical protein